MKIGVVASKSAVNRNARSYPPFQTNSFTDRSYFAVALNGLPVERPVRLAVRDDDVPLVRLVPGLLLRPPRELLAVRANFGPPSAALLSAVSVSHFGDVFVIATRQRS